MVLVTISHTLMSSALETDASSGFRVQPYTLGLTTSEWALTKHIPIRDPNIPQGNVTPKNHFTSRASQRHVAPRKNPQELSVTAVRHVTTSVSKGHFLNMLSHPEPYGVLHVLVCVVGGVVPFYAFRPHMARWAIISMMPRHAIIDAYQSVIDIGRRA